MVSIRNISKRYARCAVKSVDSLSFDIPEGKIVGFLGRNGAGKTTTIKMLTGMLTPDSGTISIGGYDIQKEPMQAKQLIGYAADDTAFFSHFNAIEYLNFFADVYGVSTEKRRKKIAYYAALFDLDSVLLDSVAGFSRGMKQKLLIIASLIHEPAVWILDEPLTGLDPQAAFTLKTLMQQYAADGHTVFFSTHILEIAEKLCSSIVIIDGGKLIFDGTYAELQHHKRRTGIFNSKGEGSGEHFLENGLTHMESYTAQSLEELFLTLTGESGGA